MWCRLLRIKCFAVKAFLSTVKTNASTGEYLSMWMNDIILIIWPFSAATYMILLKKSPLDSDNIYICDKKKKKN